MPVTFGGPVLEMVKKAEPGDLLGLQAIQQVVHEDRVVEVQVVLYACILMRTRDEIVFTVFTAEKDAIPINPSVTHRLCEENIPILMVGTYRILRKIDALLYKQARPDLPQQHLFTMTTVGAKQ